MLFHSLNALQSGMYFTQLIYTLHGDLDISAFGRAWQHLMDRHPILRTSFHWEDVEKPLQVVHQQVNLPLGPHDWRKLSPIEQEKQLQAYLRTDRHRGFELNEAPLMRLVLIQMSEDTYQFIWSYHHLLLDGWSMSTSLKEVLAFYQAFRRGQRIQLEWVRPYRDYIIWLQQQDMKKAEAFWRETLKGFTAPTPLGVDRAPGNWYEQMVDTDEQQVKLSAAATAELQFLANQHHLTLNTVVQGAWALLLSRYSGEADVVFGSVVSNRPVALAGAQSMVGLFINTLPARVQMSNEDSLLDWLKNLQIQQVEMRQYEYSPLAEVQRWSEVSRGRPLFESILVFENWEGDLSLRNWDGDLESCDVRCIEPGTGYPLTVLVGPGPELSLKVVYELQRFDAHTITRLLGHLRTLLESMAATPKSRLSDLPLLTESERHLLLVEWNNTSQDFPLEKCLHHLFEAQVERTPDAIAVVFEGEQLTYQELSRCANQLAHHLQKLGVGPDVLVGICVERSLEMIVGLLGILKAGGAYVPLDPAHPKERLAFMLKDAQVPVLLTQQRLVAGLPEHQAEVICLDTDWGAIAKESDENSVGTQLTTDHLAYVIYTSGSTGTPKGVAISHGALVNFLTAMRQKPGLTGADVLLAVTTLSFDIAALELYLPLIVGACVVLVSREVASDGAQLIKRLANSGATVMQATPATWRMLIEAGWQGSKPLKILCGGEALSRELAERLYEKGGALWNLYGPTETTIWSTVYQVDSGDGAVSIGRPIANTQLYLLDDHLQPVPSGVPGTLYIGGDGLARGYLNRPELTAERFIPHPFSGVPGARLYHTGDLARYFPDGNIEFLGRIDHQVKIRGFRIELGEIETTLAQHPAVVEAVVLAREDKPGEVRLVAYLVSDPESLPKTSDLHRLLREKLPDYMMPSAFVFIDALPLTPNGKVDRRALPAPNRARPELEETFVAPRTPRESLIAEIWQEVLGVEKVGVYDSFFELGGHSLLAMKVITRLEKQIGVRLHPMIMFSQTLGQLAAIYEEQRTTGIQQSEPKPFTQKFLHAVKRLIPH